MRTATLATTLLLGSGFACAPLAAQETTEVPTTGAPTASVTFVAQPDPVSPEAQAPAAEAPTASVTFVAQPAASATPAPTPPATPVVAPTASTTLVVPAEVTTTIATGVPTTIATGVPTTVATGVPTTVATGVPTTVATGVPTTIATGVPAAVAAPPGALPATIAPAASTVTTTSAVTPAASVTAPATTSAVIDPDTYQKRTEFDNTPWRFNMEQNGKRMTPDDFAAWMEARGVRVARGPAQHRPQNPTMDGMGGQGSTLPVGAGSSTAAAAVTASTTLVVPPAAADGLAPGSVTPTDTWQDADKAADVTTSATILVPATPPAEPARTTPLEGDEAL